MSHEQQPSLGTLFFMAPEQADLAASADARWDVYALGAILYTMLVGTPPYRNPEVVETLDSATSLPARLERYRNAIHSAPFPKQHHRLPVSTKPSITSSIAASPNNQANVTPTYNKF